MPCKEIVKLLLRSLHSMLVAGEREMPMDTGLLVATAVEVVEAPVEAGETIAATLRVLAKARDREASSRTIARLTQRCIERTGIGLDCKDADLSGCDLSGFDLRQCQLNRAALYGARLDGADLSGASLICPGLERTSFRGAILAGAYLHAVAMQVCDLSGADFSQLLDATGSLFHGCNVAGARFDGAELAGANFYQCDLSGASLRGAALRGAMFGESCLRKTDLSNADVTMLAISRCTLDECSLERASGEGLSIQHCTASTLNLAHASLPKLRINALQASALHAIELSAPGIDLTDCHLHRLELVGAYLPQARMLNLMANADMSGATLSDAALRQCQLHAVNLSQARAENISITECALVGATARQLRARSAFLRDCNLANADLSDAYLYRAVLTGDPIKGMVLTGACLRGANLVQAYCSANCEGADFTATLLTYARLNQSCFDRTRLFGTQLFEASLVKTSFQGAKLSHIEGPFFVDRCPGLSDAVLAMSDGDAARLLLAHIDAVAKALKIAHGAST